MEIQKSALIQEQNDKFREGLPSSSGMHGKVMLTSGVAELIDDEVEPQKYMPALFAAIRGFDQFDDGNDPYAEHDFGAFEFQGQKVFWKIDYYAPDMMHGSEDPSDLENTVRLMTVMLAHEY